MVSVYGGIDLLPTLGPSDFGWDQRMRITKSDGK